MNAPLRLPHPSRKASILLSVLGALVLLALVFDSNWLRHPLEQYLTKKSGRPVTIKHLNAHLGMDLDVHITVRGVHIDNTPWADARPMADIGSMSFSISPRSAWENLTVISRMVLVDADIDMEMQADGLRNWRLTRPEDRSPAKVKVLILEPHRSRIRYLNRRLDLDVTAAASDTPDATDGLSNTIDFSGTKRGVAFSGRTLTGPFLSFLDTNEFFPLRGHAVSGSARLEVDGRIADFLKLGALDAKVRVTGRSLASLSPFIPGSLPESPSFDFAMHLKKAEHEYAATNLKGRLGNSDFAGTVGVKVNAGVNADVNASTKAKPNLWRAKLRSESAAFADFNALFHGQNAAPIASSARDSVISPAHAGKLFPEVRVHAARWKSVDAEVEFEARKFSAPAIPALQSLRFTGILQDGLLTFKPLQLGLAGGVVSGSLVLDGRTPTVKGHAVLNLRDMHIEKFFPKLVDLMAPGAVSAHVNLTGHGESIAAIIGNATGNVAALMDGGSISNRLDAKMGLNIGKVVSLYFRGDRDIPLNCALLAFTFKNGTGVSQVLRLDTGETQINGAGTVTLADEKIDLLLTPQPKQPGIFTLHSLIRVRGDIRHPSVTLEKNGSPVPAGVIDREGTTLLAPLHRDSARCSEVMLNPVLPVAAVSN